MLEANQQYPSDLNDQEWAIIAHLFSKNPLGGRPVKYSRRAMWNGIFYIAKTGSQWRYLPREFPPWHRVYVQFLRWRDNGLIEQIYSFLHKKLRMSHGKNADPSAGIIDSQSVKTTEKRGSQDMTQGKRSKGEKGIF